MDDDMMEPLEPSLGRIFPWLRLLRGIGLALDGRKLILAALGVLATWAGWWSLDRLFPGEAEITASVLEVPGVLRDRVALGAPDGPVESFREAALVVTDPIRLIARPFVALFELGGGTARFGRALTMTLWAVVVWGIIGGAIARMAVVQLATLDRLGLIAALRFALGKVGTLVAAPLGPLAGVAFFAALCAVIGLLYWIPGEAGAAIAGALAFLPLLAGIVMAMILVGLAAGWPLMVATVAAECEDTFDALSRSYSYVYQRPLYYALLVAVAWAVGMVGFLVVVFLARLVLRLAAWGLAFGAPDGRIATYFGPPGTDAGTTAAAIHAGWILFVALLTYGWVYSYFWSAAAQIYLLLRHDVDGAALDDIAMPGQVADAAPGPQPPPVEATETPSAGPEPSPAEPAAS